MIVPLAAKICWVTGLLCVSGASVMVLFVALVGLIADRPIHRALGWLAALLASGFFWLVAGWAIVLIRTLVLK